MTATTVPADIAYFARRVRRALSDLPAEEVDELTDGLEADLAESFAEDLRRELPDPAAYADELRVAAGLSAPATRRWGPSAWWQRGLAAAQRRLASYPGSSPVLQLMASLRPAWWVVRAFVAAGWVFWFTRRGDGAPLPRSFTEWTLTISLVLVSAECSRRQWRGRWATGALAVANVVAAVTLVPLSQHVTDEVVTWNDLSRWHPNKAGVYLDGEPVTNVFAYDAQGDPIKDVQLFDQDGDPLNIAEDLSTGQCIDEECLDTGMYSPRAGENGLSLWNVFPLRMLKTDIYEGADSPVPGAVPQDVAPPLLKAPALAPLPAATKPAVEPMRPPEVAQNNR